MEQRYCLKSVRPLDPIPAAILGGRWVHSTPTQRVERVLGNLVSIEFFSALQRCRTGSSVIDGTPDLGRSVWATARSKNLTMIQSVLLVLQSREQLFFFGHLCTVVLSISCCKCHLGAFHIKFLGWKSDDTRQWF